MRNKQEVVKDIEILSQSKTKLQAEINQLEQQEGKVLQQASEDMLAGKGDETIKQLTDIRLKKETRNQALKLAEKRLTALGDELQNVEIEEIRQEWEKVNKECTKLLENFQNSIGANGLKGQLDKLYEMSCLAYKSKAGSSNAETFANRYQFLWVNGSRNLFEIWKEIENVWRYIDQNHKPPVSTTIEPGVIAGFGKLP